MRCAPVVGGIDDRQLSVELFWHTACSSFRRADLVVRARKLEGLGVARVGGETFKANKAKRLVVREFLGEKPCNDELGADEEPDFLLHAAVAQNAAADHLVGEVELQRARACLLDQPVGSSVHRAQRRLVRRPRAEVQLGRVSNQTLEMHVARISGICRCCRQPMGKRAKVAEEAAPFLQLHLREHGSRVHCGMQRAVEIDKGEVGHRASPVDVKWLLSIAKRAKKGVHQQAAALLRAEVDSARASGA
mmetsp:Transcript_32097/g.67512  ORF Transcript_32097/g.67512 Transcript_32097/m.67512 type:complete len:248 (+) Transcript_32097:692-1435(+)